MKVVKRNNSIQMIKLITSPHYSMQCMFIGDFLVLSFDSPLCGYIKRLPLYITWLKFCFISLNDWHVGFSTMLFKSLIIWIKVSNLNYSQKYSHNHNVISIIFRLARAQKGLQDVLFSKIGKSQRDPAIMLVASVIEVSDFVWCLTEDKETQEKGKFFLIVVNLVIDYLVFKIIYL